MHVNMLIGLCVSGSCFTRVRTAEISVSVTAIIKSFAPVQTHGGGGTI